MTAGARYVCGDERRRAALAAAGAPVGVSGIDYIEVSQGRTTADPTTIDIVLVKPLPLPAAALTAANIRLTGGVRFPAPTIEPALIPQPGGGSVARWRMTIPGGQPTDHSTYRLDLVAGPGQASPPSFIDPRLSSVEFSFKADCPADFDCAPPCDPPAPASRDPDFDYRARDWPTIRRLMLDRLAATSPGFREDDPLDLSVTVLEALAYRADQQSWRIDWVGTEALFDAARSRVSLTRHARLVDHRPGEGASARVFAAFRFDPSGAVADGATLPARTPLTPRLPGRAPGVIPADDWPALLRAGPITVFETLAPLRLWSWRNAITIHAWGDGLCRLPRGATAATLVDGASGAAPAALAPGDLLLFEQTRSPRTGRVADADPACRHVVRLTRVRTESDVLAPGLALIEVGWDAADALPFDLTIETEFAGDGPARRETCAVARGNVTVADHGLSLPPPPHLGLAPAAVESLRPRLEPAVPQPGRAWRPRLRPGPAAAGMTVARVATHGPVSHPGVPAEALSAVDPAQCEPALSLIDAFAVWRPRPDLLASGRFGRDFVIEVEADGAASLRFGDGESGLAPAPGAALSAEGRFCALDQGDMGAEALACVVAPAPLAAARIEVANPLPASGGAGPDSAARIRAAAPHAFRTPRRAVTERDYAEAAMRHPEVSGAVATARWTGAWRTMVVHVDRAGGMPADAGFAAAVRRHLEGWRLAGVDVTVRGAQGAPLDVALFVCAAPEAIRASVGAAVRAALTPFPAAGRRGFFHPDTFTFGSPLRLSALIAAAMAVPGVLSVTVTRFQRFGRAAQGELQAGVIRPSGPEILELRDDPNFPERGRLVVETGGGR
ncbi:MAG: baseplate J/gp47 family protein [Rubrimonas sp.]